MHRKMNEVLSLITIIDDVTENPVMMSIEIGVCYLIYSAVVWIM